MLAVLAEQEAAARSALPVAVFDYFVGGSGEEVTLAEAESAWRAFRLRPRVLRDVATVDISTTVLGTPLRAPILVGPSAMHGLAHPGGEVATAAGTAAAGSLVVLSTRASRRLEDVAAAAGGPWWFQVYLMRDRDLTAHLVTRAVAAGAQALVLTGDTPVVGVKRRAGRPLPLGDERYLVNLATHLAAGADPDRDTEQDPSASLDTVAWLAELSGLPVVVKGVLRADDAAGCVQAGAAAVVVSNHGGRQLDRAVDTASALPEVVQAVGNRAEVYVDGGLRSGADILAALALGARAVLVGRPALWALAAGGAGGVATMIGALQDDLRHVMTLAGAARVDQVGRDLVASARGHP